MNSRQLWNSHQKHKFLWAEASRDILKFRVPKLPFPGVFERYFLLQTPCCFVRIHARLGTMPLTCPRRSKKSHGLNINFTDLNLFKLKYSFNVIQNWETNALQILFDAAHFLSAVMVEEDESSQLRMAN